MILLYESGSINKPDKFVLCPNCRRGKIGHIPKGSDYNVLYETEGLVLCRQGDYDCIELKCPVCKSLWRVSIKTE